MNETEFFLRQKFESVAKLVPSNSKVFDIGCNSGHIKDYLINSDYYGVDIDKELIASINGRGDKAKVADLNNNELPFKKEKFDYIFLLDIVEHVVDPRNLLLSAKSRLKEGGKMVITLPNDYHIVNKLRFLFNKPLTEDVFAPYGHLHYFPIALGKKFLASCGLNIIKEIYLPPAKPNIFPLFIRKLLSRISPTNFARDVLYLVSA